MRIAIYDGILETHVGSSLQRALEVRGHQVYNTGKIGHGFEFPRPSSDIGPLQQAVASLLEFEPDVAFVMRPASLPASLMRKLRARGISLVAWLSDDPVLYDLSYGPIIDSYDYVLHCGGPQVLEFYERQFGRATGVNFPFWTDHVAFPYIWGSESPSTDLMFLGNVGDEVRRSRYFELAKLPLGIRVHGDIGSDYFGLSGGYLDHDEEVVASAASASMALNIPQFFENHRGLTTWFEGLGDLGFFEYPSRVVQYMAMGLPTISVIPGSSGFATYPEMIVANSIEEAGDLAMDWIRGGELEELSRSTLERFDRYFSAESRALALESLLTSDDWKGLDARERAEWFTQFDATAARGSQPGYRHDNSDAPIEVLRGRDEPSVDQSASLPSVVVFGTGFERLTSRSAAASQHLKELGYSVTELDAGGLSEDGKKFLVDDPQNICAHAVNAAVIVDHLGIAEGPTAFLVCGVQAALTQAGLSALRAAGYRPGIIDDSPSPTRAQMMRLVNRYSLVGVKSSA